MLCVLLGGPAVPCVAAAQWTFENEGAYPPCESNFTWDFGDLEDGSDARVVDGTCDAFDGCMRLYVDDEPFPTSTYTSAYEGRGFSTDEEQVSGVNVTRWAYVPEAGRSFARWFDVLWNPSGEVVEVKVRYRCKQGSDGAETGSSSDGDAFADATDTWVATDDDDGAGDPALAFLVQGAAAPLPLSRFLGGPGTGSVDFEYRVEIDAGEQAALLVFAVQETDREAAHDTATFLESMPDEATAGLGEAELGAVVNFVAGGAPAVSLDGPYRVAEGTTGELRATAYDADGDVLTVSWDLDGDGDFDDASGETATFDGTPYDGGPEPPVPIGVVATDGENETVRLGSVEIVNVPPSLASLPDPEAVVGFPWVAGLRPLVTDPCRTDEIAIEPAGLPFGVALDEDDRLTWTPVDDDERSDVGDHSIGVLLVDDDGGERLEEIPVSVRTNAAPERPRLVSPEEGEEVGLTRPTFVIGNSVDPDGDAVSYRIAVSWAGKDACADGDAHVESPPLPGDVSGNTSWQPTGRLCRGEPYGWSAEACDAWACSDAVEGTFSVDPDAVDEPRGGGEEPAGCACGVAGAGGTGGTRGTWAFAMAATALLFIRHGRQR